MAGFEVAGSLANSAPVKIIMPVSETMYVGQMVMAGQFGNRSG